MRLARGCMRGCKPLARLAVYFSGEGKRSCVSAALTSSSLDARPSGEKEVNAEARVADQTIVVVMFSVTIVNPCCNSIAATWRRDSVLIVQNVVHPS